MTQYNIGDLYPQNGQEVKSDGTVANPADGVDAQGNQGVSVNNRKVNYQRVLVTTALGASALKLQVVNVGNAKALNLVFNTTGNAYMQLYGADANGNAMAGGSSLFSTTTSGSTSGTILCTEWGGAPYITILIKDTSAAANTINFVDVWAAQA